MAEHDTTSEKTAPLAPVLKDSAAKASRVLWTGLVAMATLGGALGLYQFVFDREPASLPTTELVSRMFETGRITAENADTLLALLQDSASPVSNLQSVFEEGSDAQREAIAMIAVGSTRMQGLELLRAEAETAEDWAALAEFASNRKESGDIALEASRKAIALDPENIQYLLLLARTQAGMGDFAASRRTLAAASTLAITPREKLMALVSETSFDETEDLKEKRSDNIERTRQAIAVVKSLPDYGPSSEPITPDTLIENHVYVVAYSLTHLVRLHIYEEEYDTALSVTEDALAELALIEPTSEGRVREKLLGMKQLLLSYRASILHKLQRGDEHFQAHEDAIALARQLASEGNIKAERRLPGLLYGVAHEYNVAGQSESAVARTEEAIALQTDIDARYPDEWERRYALQSMRASMALFAGDAAGRSREDAKLVTMIEDDLLREGLLPERISYLVRLPQTVRFYWNEQPDAPKQLSPLLAQIDGVHSRLLKRFGPHEQLDRLKLGNKLERALQHAGMGNTETAAEIMAEVEQLSEALPEGFEGRGGFYLYALYYRAKYDADNAARYAERALAYTQPLQAVGELPTGEQWAIAHFTRVKNGDPTAYPSDD